jgi:hypothetical protein
MRLHVPLEVIFPLQLIAHWTFRLHLGDFVLPGIQRVASPDVAVPLLVPREEFVTTRNRAGDLWVMDAVVPLVFADRVKDFLVLAAWKPTCGGKFSGRRNPCLRGWLWERIISRSWLGETCGRAGKVR